MLNIECKKQTIFFCSNKWLIDDQTDQCSGFLVLFWFEDKNDDDVDLMNLQVSITKYIDR